MAALVCHPVTVTTRDKMVSIREAALDGQASLRGAMCIQTSARAHGGDMNLHTRRTRHHGDRLNHMAAKLWLVVGSA